MKKKRSITLIEIMIVILLIGLIGGALAYNMRGSLEKGRAFKTEQNIERVRDILLLEQARTEKTLGEIVKDSANIIKKSPLVKNGNQLVKDAWGIALDIKVEKDEIVIKSQKLDAFNKAHG